MDLNENRSISSTWVPGQPLRTAADLKEPGKKTFHRKTVSSPSASPSKHSVSVEVKANSPTSNTIHFNSLHSRYNTATLDISPHQDLPESSERKYINNISRLNEEIFIMSTQLKQANETIALLTQRLNENNSKHALHLQSLHERHEQKIRRNKQDMENLLKEVHSKSPNLALEKIILEKNLELELQKRKYQEKIEEMTRRFEYQIDSKENQHKSQISLLKDQFLDIVVSLKEKFFDDICALQGQFKLEVDRVQSSFDEINDDALTDENEEKTHKNILTKENLEIDRKSENFEDLQLIEELSSQPIIRKNFRDSAGSDLDLSLKILINQINLEHETSLTDLLRN